jgi:hypothetical protein
MKSAENAGDAEANKTAVSSSLNKTDVEKVDALAAYQRFLPATLKPASLKFK